MEILSILTIQVNPKTASAAAGAVAVGASVATTTVSGTTQAGVVEGGCIEDAATATTSVKQNLLLKGSQVVSTGAANLTSKLDENGYARTSSAGGVSLIGASVSSSSVGSTAKNTLDMTGKLTGSKITVKVNTVSTTKSEAKNSGGGLVAVGSLVTAVNESSQVKLSLNKARMTATSGNIAISGNLQTNATLMSQLPESVSGAGFSTVSLKPTIYQYVDVVTTGAAIEALNGDVSVNTTNKNTTKSGTDGSTISVAIGVQNYKIENKVTTETKYNLSNTRITGKNITIAANDTGSKATTDISTKGIGGLYNGNVSEAKNNVTQTTKLDITGGTISASGKVDISAVNDATLSATGKASSGGFISTGSATANNSHTRTVNITLGTNAVVEATGTESINITTTAGGSGYDYTNVSASGKGLAGVSKVTIKNYLKSNSTVVMKNGATIRNMLGDVNLNSYSNSDLRSTLSVEGKGGIGDARGYATNDITENAKVTLGASGDNAISIKAKKTVEIAGTANITAVVATVETLTVNSTANITADTATIGTLTVDGVADVQITNDLAITTATLNADATINVGGNAKVDTLTIAGTTDLDVTGNFETVTTILTGIADVNVKGNLTATDFTAESNLTLTVKGDATAETLTVVKDLQAEVKNLVINEKLDVDGNAVITATENINAKTVEIAGAARCDRKCSYGKPDHYHPGRWR